MKDHIVVADNEIIQCKNDIVTHYFIDKLNNIVLREGKTLGLRYAELCIGSRGEEIVLDKGYSKKKIDEINNVYKKMQADLEQRPNYVDFGGNTNINMDKLYKVSKVISSDEVYYRVVFTDGQMIETDYIDDDAKHIMKYGRENISQERV